MSIPDANDEQLIVEYIASNKEEVFRILLDRYTKHIYNFIRQMVGNDNDALDITQELFIKVWKNIK